jgi:hypothetical protein
VSADVALRDEILAKSGWLERATGGVEEVRQSDMSTSKPESLRRKISEYRKNTAAKRSFELLTMILSE